jgi:hypothetical protein
MRKIILKMKIQTMKKMINLMKLKTMMRSKPKNKNLSKLMMKKIMKLR